MSVRKNLWFHVFVSIGLMFCLFVIFFGAFYGAGKSTTSTAFFICFTIILIITFSAYRTNYRAVPTRRMLKKYKYDRELLAEERKQGGRTAIGVILLYLPLNLFTLCVSLLLVYA